jgi:membrane protein implicated in regulation of membrane protease activity
MSSPISKFILITIDELILVPIALVLIAMFVPEYFLLALIIAIPGSIIFVAVKWYIVYPALQEGSYKLYDLKDMEGTVISTVTPNSGKIKVGQEIWDARCENDEIPKGTIVRVISRQSMKVKVEALE